jgi:hypothetical protein
MAVHFVVDRMAILRLLHWQRPGATDFQGGETMSHASQQSPEPWSRIALAALPPEGEVIERNRAITAAYAAWYRDHPHLYKWAGAAAFASYRVGLALLPYHLDAIAQTVEAKGSVGDDAGPVLFGDVDRLRQTNTAVYVDTAWAHLALVDPRGGIAAVREGLAAQTSSPELIAGFEAIEQGRLLLEASAGSNREAEARIWEGNRLLLYHEQHHVIQPLVETVGPAFRIFLSVMTQIDFGMPDGRPDFRTYTAFQKFMSKKLRPLARFNSFADRWQWIEESVLETWKQVDATDEKLKEKIAKLIAKGTAQHEVS